MTGWSPLDCIGWLPTAVWSSVWVERMLCSGTLACQSGPTEWWDCIATTTVSPIRPPSSRRRPRTLVEPQRMDVARDLAWELDRYAGDLQCDPYRWLMLVSLLQIPRTQPLLDRRSRSGSRWWSWTRSLGDSSAPRGGVPRHLAGELRHTCFRIQEFRLPGSFQELLVGGLALLR